MQPTKKVYLCLLLFSFCYSQNPFEGKIEFLYYHRDTTKNVYWVKEPFIRLDQLSKNKDGGIEGSFLFNLHTKEIKMISPKRKLWSIHKSTIPPVIKGKCEVIKTNNTRKITGIDCTEYIVKNTSEDTEISYWIHTSGNYNFFIPLLELWNRKDKPSIYFNQIKNIEKGAMPLLSIEKQISTGRIISKLETIKISKEKLNDTLFTIPEDYKKFEE